MLPSLSPLPPAPVTRPASQASASPKDLKPSSRMGDTEGVQGLGTVDQTILAMLQGRLPCLPA